MKLETRKQNLFDVSNDYYLAHCISADYALGAGIAVDFQKRFHLKDRLKAQGSGSFPDCIQIGRVFNLVTKGKYWSKPTYESLRGALEQMRGQAVALGVEMIAMPKIGCGLDRLAWAQVRELIEGVFSETEIEMLVCYI